jgi:hypothetical protein
MPYNLSTLLGSNIADASDRNEKWPRRETDWHVVDRGTHVEILRRAETRSFANDEEAAAFAVLAAQNPGAPDDVRRECLLALEEILYCASIGIEAWREEYSGPGRWQELLACQDEEEDPRCACEGTGFLVMNEDRYDTGEALGELQACDTCNIFPTDEDAADAARAAGYTVNDEGLVLSEPCRQRALRRWGA